MFIIPWQTLHHPFLRWALKQTHGFWEWLLGLRTLRKLYHHCLTTSLHLPFPQRILDILRVKVTIHDVATTPIPKEGPLIIVANHPFGAIEGLALLECVRQSRPDVKVMANYLLDRIPELRNDMFFVDPFGRADSTARNVQALRHALQWLRNGKALIIFPAGEVASFAPKAFRVRDAQWQTSVMTLIRRIERPAHVLPVFIPGSASILFHLVGKIHPRLRTLLLPRELLRRRNRKLELRLGTPLSTDTLFQRFTRDEDALRYLRFRTFLLAGRTGTSAFDERMRLLTMDEITRNEDPIIDPVNPDLIEAELLALPETALLLETDDFTLYAAPGHAIPHTLRDIGRLREITFRAIGEGTGNPLDSDEFDPHYTQLILWHHERREIVGSYRLALSDTLVESAGLHALYTRTLFKFDERFLGYLPGPAIELGRSFVRPEYQRTFSPLLLLWRGVLTFVALHPQYTILFGPVSISHDFRPATRDLLITYLRKHAYDETLAQYVSARLPPKSLHFVEWRHPDYADFLEDDTDINLAINELEEGKHEMPILIRQYRKLGGKIVAFNVDPDFGTVVDGLIVVDLLKAPPRDIARYMGKDLYTHYRSTHHTTQ